MLPLCFVLMPVGRQSVTGRTVDFDAVFEQLVRPALAAAGMEPLREAPEMGGEARESVFERLLLCDFALVDLDWADTKVIYELGRRQVVRPSTTLLLAAESPTPSPFDTVPLPTLGYAVNADGVPANANADAEKLAERLRELQRPDRKAAPVSAVLRLLEDDRTAELDRLKTDIFRTRAAYDPGARELLAAARQTGKAAVHAAASQLGVLETLETGVVIDLFLSLRAVSDWQGMLDLAARMPAPLARIRMVHEQVSLALNRLGRRDEAETRLLRIITDHGPSSETNSLLGRVYKDRWEQAHHDNDSEAAAWLDKAIETYLQGFEADWRDAYPGINCVTLMELRTPPDPRQSELLPVIGYAIRRRIASGESDYWDHAALLELAVLRRDEPAARAALAAARAAIREAWEPESTARNLRLIYAARRSRGETSDWLDDIQRALLASAEPGKA
ncbi:MAG: TRAFs-binding domain-containing protein [Thiotrichales bacterium]